MSVRLELVSCPDGVAAEDLRSALDQAQRARGAQGRQDHALLLDLLTKYLQEDLWCMPEEELMRYWRTRQVWRREGGVHIVKTPDEPCVAFTLIQRDDDVVLLVLGFAYRYPTTEDAWWKDVLLPRLRHFL